MSYFCYILDPMHYKTIILHYYIITLLIIIQGLELLCYSTDPIEQNLPQTFLMGHIGLKGRSGGPRGQRPLVR